MRVKVESLVADAGDGRIAKGTGQPKEKAAKSAFCALREQAEQDITAQPSEYAAAMTRSKPDKNPLCTMRYRTRNARSKSNHHDNSPSRLLVTHEPSARKTAPT